MIVTEQELIERSQYPRVTLEYLESQIVKKEFIQRDLLTICVLTLKNGFMVTGQSACAVPANFNLDIGQRLAEKQAVGQIWPLLGYELKSMVAMVQKVDGPSSLLAETYMGTKVIHAHSMNRLAYVMLRGWELPADEDGNDEGYLVEYPDQTSNLLNYKGYVSWSPKAVFERNYQQMSVRGPIGGLTWKDRAQIEKDELIDKLDKLTTMLANPKLILLPSDQQTLLWGQMSAMASYLAILKMRLGEVEMPDFTPPQTDPE